MRAPGELRAVVRNMTLKALSLGFERGCRLAVTVVAAPILGAAAFGQLVFATTVTAMLALGADLGLGLWTTRALARARTRGDDGRDTVGSSLFLRALTVLPYGLAVIVVRGFVGPWDARLAVGLLGIAAFCNGALDHFASIFRGLEDFSAEAKLNALRSLVLAAASFVALAVGRSLVSLSLALATASVVALASGSITLGRRFSAPGTLQLPRVPGWLELRAVLRDSLPLAAAGLLSLFYFKVDTFFVRSFAGDAELGAYGAAYKLFEGAMLLPAVVLAVSFPRIVRAHEGRDRARSFEGPLTVVLLLAGAVVGGLFFFGAGPLIELFFGTSFGRAKDSLRVLAYGLPLVYANFGLTHFLVARGRERINTALALMMLVFTVGLDCALVPRGGGPGAAAATALAEIALTLGCLLALRTPRSSLA